MIFNAVLMVLIGVVLLFGIFWAMEYAKTHMWVRNAWWYVPAMSVLCVVCCGCFVIGTVITLAIVTGSVMT